jgi:hypothetical protein
VTNNRQALQQLSKGPLSRVIGAFRLPLTQPDPMVPRCNGQPRHDSKPPGPNATHRRRLVILTHALVTDDAQTVAATSRSNEASLNVARSACWGRKSAAIHLFNARARAEKGAANLQDGGRSAAFIHAALSTARVSTEYGQMNPVKLVQLLSQEEEEPRRLAESGFDFLRLTTELTACLSFETSWAGPR